MHMTPLKKDIKYNIKITKSKSLIGIAEFSLPSVNLQQKDASYSKLCSVTMTDSMKRIVFGNIKSGNTIKLQVNANIQFVDKITALKQSHSLPKKEMKQIPLSPKVTYKPKQQSELISKEQVRETKTPPMKTLKKQTIKPNSTTKKGAQSNNSPIAKQSGVSQSTISQSDKKTILPPEVDQIDTSIIDQLANEEILQIDKQFNDFITKCIDEFNITSIHSMTDLNELISKSKESISKIFALQLKYYCKMHKSIELNNALKNLLLKYNEKFRSIIKKQNKLKQLLEKNCVAKEIAETIRPEEEERTKEIIPIKKQELNIYKSVFKQIIKEDEMTGVKEHNRQEKENGLLIQVMKNVIATHGNLSKVISNNQLSSYQSVLAKYSLTNQDNIVKSNIEQKQMSFIPENKINEENEDEEDTKEDKDNKNVIGSPLDQKDIKLNRYLNIFYSKRKIIKIPFKKITPYNYEYGTQKIMLKIEGDVFKVRNIGGYTLLDKFIEMNAPIEEVKMNQNPNAKFPSTKIKSKQN